MALTSDLAQHMLSGQQQPDQEATGRAQTAEAFTLPLCHILSFFVPQRLTFMYKRPESLTSFTERKLGLRGSNSSNSNNENTQIQELLEMPLKS